MAITATTITNGSGVKITAGTSMTTLSMTFTAGKVYIFAVMTRTNASVEPNVPTITMSGVVFSTGVSSYYDPDSTSRKKETAFSATAASTSSATALIDLAGQSQTDIAYAVIEMDGVDTTAAIVQSATNSLPDGSAPAGITATLGAFSSVNNATVGVFANGTETATFTAGSGFTKVIDQALGSSNGRVAIEFKASNDTTVDMTQSGATPAMGGIGLEIKALVIGGSSISKVSGVAQASISKVSGTALASISKVSGVAN